MLGGMTKIVRFIARGRLVELADPAPTLTVLDYLREHLHSTGTKEGCGEGDCGACTVAIARLDERMVVGGNIQYSSTNSCIRFATSLDGCALISVEDLEGQHPAQQAMVACHASQCGFCTPGFVMSLAVAHQCNDGLPMSREQVGDAISGNLCRCTGYRPIVEAALTMNQYAPTNDASTSRWWHAEKLLPRLRDIQAPLALQDFLKKRAEFPDAQIIAGCTDVGLWVTKQHKHFKQSLDTTQVPELRVISAHGSELSIGAAVTLDRAFDALSDWTKASSVNDLAHRFAGKPVRSTGTLGGNIVNGSPIGDSMPVLLALEARVKLMSVNGEREVALKDFYLGYRKTVLAANEILTEILVPKFAQGARLFAYKVSKRFEDDISAVCLVMHINAVEGIAQDVRIGVGGMAAIPMRAALTEKCVNGATLNMDTFAAAKACIMDEFAPLSDMRASASYRSQVIGNLLLRVFYELEAQQPTSVFA
jgi:xanthine dehydrogenase small subunit